MRPDLSASQWNDIIRAVERKVLVSCPFMKGEPEELRSAVGLALTKLWRKWRKKRGASIQSWLLTYGPLRTLDVLERKGGVINRNSRRKKKLSCSIPASQLHRTMDDFGREDWRFAYNELMEVLDPLQRQIAQICILDNNSYQHVRKCLHYKTDYIYNKHWIHGALPKLKDFLAENGFVRDSKRPRTKKEYEMSVKLPEPEVSARIPTTFPLRVITVGSEDNPATAEDVKKVVTLLHDLKGKEISIQKIPSVQDRIEHLKRFNQFMEESAKLACSE